MPKPSSKVLIILAFFAIYVIWGSTYLLNKIAVTEVAPLYLAAFRFIIAGLLIVAIARLMKLPLGISKKQLWNCSIAGFLFIVYGNGVFVWALKYVDSGFAALEASTQPLFVLLIMRIVDGKKMHPKSLFGVVLGVIGMYILVSQKELITTEDTVKGMLMILSCVLIWSYASVFVSKADLPQSYFVSTGYQMLIGGTILFISSLLLGETWKSPLDWTIKVKWCMIILIIFGSIVAFTAFNYLLKIVSTEKVATSAYVNPIIALFLGWLVLDEHLSLQSIIAAIVLLTGVYFITSKKNTATKDSV